MPYAIADSVVYAAMFAMFVVLLLEVTNSSFAASIFRRPRVLIGYLIGCSIVLLLFVPVIGIFVFLRHMIVMEARGHGLSDMFLALLPGGVLFLLIYAYSTVFIVKRLARKPGVKVFNP